ncbi:probable cytochrome P450 304a1 [Teleopsis dalmanni]|uniref:probable cytochrome P450 304a1 n=1 Tax=Teleopsis dalmanni TaxID=139649 RepID=UPI0018CFA119|nr:probable cytochrome P450 304a1 [Teleopsis dalmanni]
MSEILWFLSALFFLYLSYRYAVGRPAGFPPGPPRIPLFGSYLFMMMSNFKYLHKGVLKFSKWYKSDIIGFHVGSLPVIAVHNAEGIRQVLNNQSFDGRTHIRQTFLAEMREPDGNILGIFFQEGLFWKEQRRFIVRYLRDFGFGRRFEQLELVIQEELTDMLDLIRNGPLYEHEKEIVKPGGYRVLLPSLLHPFSGNSLFHIIYNERHPRSEQGVLLKLTQMAMQFQREGDSYGKLLSIIPWITNIFPNWSSYNKLMEANIFLYKYFSNFIDRHIETYQDGYERNFLDLYIKEMKQAEAEGKTDSTFSRKQFIMSLIDFSIPALSTTGVQITFLIQYLLLYPEVMKRIQKEIDEVIGSGRLPTLEDRKKMHYTEATIREGLRIATLLPSDVAHKALEDTELMGYKVPKNTVIIPGLYAYHMDERIWGDPENFRPERFLDDEGKLCLKKDMSLPFSAGKRSCAGETFARNMLFLMTTTLCQNFNFVLAPGDKLPDLSETLSGLISSPPDFWVQLEDRK